MTQPELFGIERYSKLALASGAKTKRCNGCGVTKALSEYYLRHDRKTPRVMPRCRACQKEKSTRWRVKNPEKVAESLTRTSRNRRLRGEQRLGAGPIRCEICGGAFVGVHHNGPQYDHNHDTDAARGWLCSKCNIGLGALGDNPKILDRAAEYLRERSHAQSRPVIR